MRIEQEIGVWHCNHQWGAGSDLPLCLNILPEIWINIFVIDSMHRHEFADEIQDAVIRESKLMQELDVTLAIEEFCKTHPLVGDYWHRSAAQTFANKITIDHKLHFNLGKHIATASISITSA